MTPIVRGSKVWEIKHTQHVLELCETTEEKFGMKIQLPGLQFLIGSETDDTVRGYVVVPLNPFSATQQVGPIVLFKDDIVEVEYI